MCKGLPDEERIIDRLSSHTGLGREVNGWLSTGKREIIITLGVNVTW